jgi:membrane-bound lytic murein transglycosylase D
VDERRDPVRSTDAALKFIGWLREQFGSLYLACAAYNGGPGRVSRGLTRFSEDLEGTSGEDVFFALAEKDYLREETKNYVPQLLAAALIAKSPEKYGVRIERLPAYAYDSVMVPAKTPLAIVARASRSRTGEIVELNPHLLRGVTPPGAPIYVRVPVGRAAEFDAALAEIPDSDRVAFKKMVSKKGETLNGFAARSGRSARVLHWYNPKLEVTRKGKLAAGQTILVPTAEVAAAAQDVPDPSIERYGAPKSAKIRMHVVKRGENLGAIARRYRTTPERIKALNGMRGSMIYPGQQLVVKGEVARARSSRSASARRSGAAPHYGARDDARRPAASRSSGKSSSKKAAGKKSSTKKAQGKRATKRARR